MRQSKSKQGQILLYSILLLLIVGMLVYFLPNAVNSIDKKMKADRISTMLRRTETEVLSYLLTREPYDCSVDPCRLKGYQYEQVAPDGSSTPIAPEADGFTNLAFIGTINDFTDQSGSDIVLETKDGGTQQFTKDVNFTLGGRSFDRPVLFGCDDEEKTRDCFIRVASVSHDLANNQIRVTLAYDAGEDRHFSTFLNRQVSAPGMVPGLGETTALSCPNNGEILIGKDAEDNPICKSILGSPCPDGEIARDMNLSTLSMNCRSITSAPVDCPNGTVSDFTWDFESNNFVSASSCAPLKDLGKDEYLRPKDLQQNPEGFVFSIPPNVHPAYRVSENSPDQIYGGLENALKSCEDAVACENDGAVLSAIRRFDSKCALLSRNYCNQGARQPHGNCRSLSAHPTPIDSSLGIEFSLLSTLNIEGEDRVKAVCKSAGMCACN